MATRKKKAARKTSAATLRRKLSPALRAAIEAGQSASASGGDGWRPEEENEFLAGTIISARGQETKYGTSPLIHVDDARFDSPRSLFLSTVLRYRFYQDEIRAGSEVVITYKGQGEATRGRPPRLYHVQLVKPGAGDLIVATDPAEEKPRKKTTRKKAPAKKTARKKTTRKKAPAKKTARKKVARKKARRK